LRTLRLRPHCEPCAASKGRDHAIIDHEPGEEALCGCPHKVSYAAPGIMRREHHGRVDMDAHSQVRGLFESA
jgi:hypothetical protein